MVVTKVEMLTKIKYKVYLDEEFAFVLYKGELSHYRIVEGTLLEEDTVQEILQKVICKRAKLVPCIFWRIWTAANRHCGRSCVRDCTRRKQWRQRFLM